MRGEGWEVSPLGWEISPLEGSKKPRCIAHRGFRLEFIKIMNSPRCHVRNDAVCNSFVMDSIQADRRA